MLTDAPPRKPDLMAFGESDRTRTIPLPEAGVLREVARSIEIAMKSGTTTNVRSACQEFLEITADFTVSPDAAFGSWPLGPCGSVKTGRANFSGITLPIQRA